MAFVISGHIMTVLFFVVAAVGAGSAYVAACNIC